MFDKPWKVAAARAVVGGLVLGAVTFFAIWPTTDDTKTLLIAFFAPFFGVIGQRGVAEGWWDTLKGNGSNVIVPPKPPEPTPIPPPPTPAPPPPPPIPPSNP
jgi:hypothetical protein